jgi:hypothetical protein
MNIRLAAITGIVCFYSIAMGSLDRLCAQETQRQKQERSSQQNEYRDQSQNVSQDQAQQPVRTFTGKISQKNNKFFMEEALHPTSYRLVDTWEVKRFIGKKVRVTGWFDEEQNILHVKSISLCP